MADAATCPIPLTPEDCDLRDFAFMPIDIMRLFASEFHATACDAAWRAGVTLWLKSWHQVPAGSLPDDDVLLTRLGELGRDLKAWKKIRDQALHGWVQCGDGRLYHRVVAEKVLEAWLEKLRQRLASGAGNAKRWKVDFDPAPVQASIAQASTLLAILAPNSKALAKAQRYLSSRDPTGTPDAIPVGSQSDRKGQGQGQGPPIITPSGVGAAKPAPRAKRGTRLPDDWELPAEWLAWATDDRRWSEQRVRAVALGFRDYWWGKAGKDAVKVDWFATFRGWCRREEQGPAGVPRSAVIGANLPGNCTPIGSPC